MMSGMEGLDAVGCVLHRAFLDHEHDVAKRYEQALASDPDLSAVDFAAAYPFVAPVLDQDTCGAVPAEGRHGR